ALRRRSIASRFPDFGGCAWGWSFVYLGLCRLLELVVLLVQGSIRCLRASDKSHGPRRIGTPSSLTTDADGIRQPETGPCIPFDCLDRHASPLAFTQLVLFDLSGGGLREFTELDCAGDLEAGQ